MTIVRYFHLFFIGLFLLGALVLGALCAITHHQPVDFSVLENYNAGSPSLLLDDAGNEWGRFQLDRREPIALDQMPPHLIKAFLAAEDWAFFDHAGISWKGIFRSTLINIYHGKIVQGASTITQQLVKLLFFDAARTFKRKLKEQFLSLVVEQQYTKEQILETYLNHIYFGCGIYGVQAASQRFWGKAAADLTLEEAATLAGIVRSPARYCPITCPLSAQKRRDVVLHSMQKLSLVTRQEYDQAKEVAVRVLSTAAMNPLACHARESLRIQLEGQVGKRALYTGGLIIQTTLNSDLQRTAEKSFHEHCKQLKESLSPEIDGALITLDTKTGGIKALIGGYDFDHSKFNRAVQAKRQIGSTFKPLIYAGALQAGLTFADTSVDEPIEIIQGTTVWRPKNAYGSFGDTMTLAYALSHSTNIVPIKLLFHLGYQPVIDLAKKCHLSGLSAYPSLALGCVDATVKEVAGMFNIFANNGTYVEPHLISWIKDRWGTKIFKAKPTRHPVMSAETSGQVAKVLEHGLERVHAAYPQPWLECQAISKTGTTNDSRTCWYTGSTPDFTTVVYIGLDNNASMGKDVYPRTTAFPIWLSVMRAAPITHKNFIRSSSLKEIVVHEKTGRRAKKGTAGAIALLVPA